jgi:single-strand DNA-binding protein
MLNKIVVQGRLVRDPEMRKTQAGNSVANFTLAVDRDREVNGERLTDFIDVVAWAGGAEFVSKYFRKGQMAVVSGRLQSRDWEDKDGNARKSWEIVSDGIYFGEAKKG